MTDQGSKEAENTKRRAERSAKVVLAKHPYVVAGATHPMPIERDAPPREVEFGERQIARDLRR